MVASTESTESTEPTPVEAEVVEEKPAIKAVTANNPNISIDLLEVLLKPLPQKNLQAEADAWFALLEAKAQEISEKEAAIKRQGNQGEISEDFDQVIIILTQLKTEQSNLVNRLTTVLDALDAKGGDTETYRQYVGVVSGLELNFANAEGLGLRLTTWLTSPEGGIRLGFDLLKFAGILITATFISPRLAQLTNSALTRITNISNLFRGFMVMIVQRGVLVVGALLALASIGVNLGPILALVGGASFVLAFALQSNLGNFASGLMLLINKPFDVGDEVKIAEYWAYVDSISIASTKLKDFDGNIVTLPNNTVWGSEIINYTHAEMRQIQLSIHVKFTQDINVIEQMWMEITASHPKVLKTPESDLFPWNTNYNYYIWVELNAWTKTEDHWPVYVELLKQIQQRLQELNVELATPVQTIKVDSSSASSLKHFLTPGEKA
ncbi:MAG: mechanosensitive ion channel family protein [Cyanobacteria bacterium J06592_8]